MAGPALEEFAGVWTLSRVIEDRALGRTGRMTGVAAFTREGAVLICRESGILRFPGGGGMPAERVTRWRNAGGGLIAVEFADGRPFHDFSSGSARATALHDCAPDRYEVLYDFSRWPVWTAEWRVAGPRKDYTMRTVYGITDG